MASFKINPSEEPAFQKILSDEGFKFSDHQYAFWRAQAKGGTVVFFKKGTLLIQGSEQATRWIQNLLFSTPPEKQTRNKIDKASAKRTLGLDESGKGDCFGPLVLAAAIVDKELENEIQKLGVKDSKKLSDATILSLSEKLTSIVPYKVRIILPEEYNRLYAETNNLNLLMTSEYQNLITSLKSEHYTDVILDNYSLSTVQKTAIHQAADLEVLIIKEAEQYPSVAAASILARAAFVRTLQDLEQKHHLQLPKGSGKESQALFRQYRETLSSEDFARIAKTHFKIF